MRPALFLAAVLLAGCQDDVVGPDPLDLVPRLEGTWVGTFDGRLDVVGVPGQTTRDTFRVTLDVARLGADFGYTGRIQRGADGAADLYDCQPRPVVVDRDRRVSFRCVQGTQLGETTVLRLQTQANAAFDTLTGTVLAPEAYPITLTKSD